MKFKYYDQEEVLNFMKKNPGKWFRPKDITKTNHKRVGQKLMQLYKDKLLFRKTKLEGNWHISFYKLK